MSVARQLVLAASFSFALAVGCADSETAGSPSGTGSPGASSSSSGSGGAGGNGAQGGAGGAGAQGGAGGQGNAGGQPQVGGAGGIGASGGEGGTGGTGGGGICDQVAPPVCAVDSTDCFFGFSSDGTCEWGCRDQDDNTYEQECVGPNCLCKYNGQVLCACVSADSCGTTCCPAPWVTPDSAPPPQGCGTGGAGSGGSGTGGSGTGGVGTGGDSSVSVTSVGVTSGSGP